uniref:Uncharacterized protein n=1 Tax=Eptatretus burgeri TaxID=7764 RepID=A0A8C4QMP8_EPTBU
MAFTGNVGKQELLERLRRQERLLDNREFLKTLPDGGVKVEELVYRLRTAVSRLSEAHHLAGVLSNATHERTVPCPVRGTTLIGCGGGGGGEACLDPESPNQVVHVSLNRCIKSGGTTSPKVCELGAGVRKVGKDGDKFHNDVRLVQVINNNDNDNNRVQDCFAESTNEQMSENFSSHMIGGRPQVDGP